MEHIDDTGEPIWINEDGFTTSDDPYRKHRKTVRRINIMKLAAWLAAGAVLWKCDVPWWGFLVCIASLATLSLLPPGWMLEKR